MILGIDYGRAHLGLATSMGELAEPWGTIDYKDQESGIKKIGEVCSKLDVELIVIGISEGKMAEETQAFGNKLASMLRLPVKFGDETLTSLEADTGRKKDSGKDHQRAAAIILERYLDSLH